MASHCISTLADNFVSTAKGFATLSITVDDAQVREDAIEAIANIAGAAATILREATSAIEGVIRSDEEASVRARACRVLEQIEASRSKSEVTGAPIPHVAPKEDESETRKRKPGELEKCLLALLETCLEWKERNVSERQLHKSSILARKRKAYGLAPRFSQTTVHNHLNVLARLCGVKGLLEIDDARQTSRFRAGVLEKLQVVRVDLVEHNQKKETMARYCHGTE